jgi:hypothetical protein
VPRIAATTIKRRLAEHKRGEEENKILTEEKAEKKECK